MSAKLAEVLPMSPNADFGTKIELIDTDELASRTKLPKSWIRSHCQPRCPEADRIPRMSFGRYIRFAWGSRELSTWLESRKVR